MARYAIFWLLAGLLVCCGCSSLASSWNSFSPFVDRPVVASRQNPVVEIACMWQPGEGRGPKGVPARGFAGQVYFFTRNNAEPVLANGDVRVYLFADTESMETRTKPLHQYDFGAEAWMTHAARTSLGPGYNVFVPYPGQAHYQMRCQLRVRYQPSEGPPVWSEALTVVLDGPPRPDDAPITWMSGEAGPVPENKLTITHERISADKLAALKKRGGDAEESALRVDTFDVSKLRHALHESDSETERNIEPAKFEETSAEDVSRESHFSKHPMTDMSEEQKQAIIARVLGRESAGGDREAGRGDRESGHPLADSFGRDAEFAASDHPLRAEGGGDVDDGWSGHPLSPNLENPVHQPSTLNDLPKSRHPLSHSDRAGDDWRSAGGAHPLTWRERGELRQRFVKPRPNRAVLLSRQDLFEPRADGSGTQGISRTTYENEPPAEIP